MATWEFTYKINSRGIIHRIEDGIIIPNDPKNIAYKIYQEWLEEGNTPIADPQEKPNPVDHPYEGKEDESTSET
jgi:hypothetical protein